MSAFVAPVRRGFGGGITHKFIRHQHKHSTCTNINLALLGAPISTHTRYYASTTILNCKCGGHSSPQRNQLIGLLFATLASCVSSPQNNNAECAPSKRPPPTNTTTPVNNPTSKKGRGSKKLDPNDPLDHAFMLVSMFDGASIFLFLSFFMYQQSQIRCCAIRFV